MRLRLFLSALLVALALPVAASAAGAGGYCETLGIAVGSTSAPSMTPIPSRVAYVEDPLLKIGPSVLYACSNRCRRNCNIASQSCRASRRTCQRRLTACIRRCGC